MIKDVIQNFKKMRNHVVQTVEKKVLDDYNQYMTIKKSTLKKLIMIRVLITDLYFLDNCNKAFLKHTELMQKKETKYQKLLDILNSIELSSELHGIYVSNSRDIMNPNLIQLISKGDTCYNVYISNCSDEFKIQNKKLKTRSFGNLKRLYIDIATIIQFEEGLVQFDGDHIIIDYFDVFTYRNSKGKMIQKMCKGMHMGDFSLLKKILNDFQIQSKGDDIKVTISTIFQDVDNILIKLIKRLED